MEVKESSRRDVVARFLTLANCTTSSYIVCSLADNLQDTLLMIDIADATQMFYARYLTLTNRICVKILTQTLLSILRTAT